MFLYLIKPAESVSIYNFTVTNELTGAEIETVGNQWADTKQRFEFRFDTDYAPAVDTPLLFTLVVDGQTMTMRVTAAAVE